MAKVYDLLAYSHRLYNDQTVNAFDVQVGIETLNAMLESWAVDSCAIFRRTREIFSIAAGDSWTIGPGAVLDTIRPIKVLTVQYTFGGTGWPLEQMSPDDWEAQYGKLSAIGQPQYWYYEQGFPTSTLHLWPPATASEIGVVSEKPIASYSAADQELNLPPGYYNAIAYNLSCELAPQEGKEVPRTTMLSARRYKNQLARLYYTVPTITPDGPKGSRYNNSWDKVTYGNADDWGWSP